MTKKTRPTYSSEFHLEVALQVVDKGRATSEVAKSMGLGSLKMSVMVSFQTQPL